MTSRYYEPKDERATKERVRLGATEERVPRPVIFDTQTLITRQLGVDGDYVSCHDGFFLQFGKEYEAIQYRWPKPSGMHFARVKVHDGLISFEKLDNFREQTSEDDEGSELD